MKAELQNVKWAAATGRGEVLAVREVMMRGTVGGASVCHFQNLFSAT